MATLGPSSAGKVLLCMGLVPEALVPVRRQTSAAAVGGARELKLSCKDQILPLECYGY